MHHRHAMSSWQSQDQDSQEMLLLLLLQGLSGLHAMERGMSDLKADNIRVQLAADDTAHKLTLIDFGGSACYTGQSNAT